MEGFALSADLLACPSGAERAHIVRWARGGSAPAFDGQLVLALPGQQAVALQDQLAHLVPPDPCRAWSGRVLRHVGGGPVGGDALDAVEANPVIASPVGAIAVDALVLPRGQKIE